MVRRAAVALALLAACYERGGARREPRDAGAPVAAAMDARAATASALDPARRDPAAVVRIALEAEPATLEPLIAAEGATQRILGEVFEGLLCPGDGPAAPPVACLATRWEESSDHRTWRFALRPGVRFHDGAALTAGDVAFSFELLRGPARSHLAAEIDDLRAVRVDGERVVLTFGRVRADREVALSRVPIVERRVYDGIDLAKAGALEAAAQGRLPVGTGPLRVTGWRRGEGVTLARWDGYWGAPAAAAEVRYLAIADRDEGLRRLASARLDVVYQVPPEQAVRFSDEHRGLRRFGYALPAYLAAVYNARRPALATAAARRGLTALFDRATVRREVLGGAPAITGPFPTGDPGIDPSVVEIPFDPALARALLPAPPALTLLVPQGSRAMARVADIWAADARGAAALAIEEVPFGDLVARLREGRFDVALLSMTTGPELDLWSRLDSHAPADEAWTGLRDRELDRLLEQVRDEPDAARRPALRRALHRRIAEVVPMAFIAADARMGLAGGDVGGLGDGRGGPPPARRLWRARGAP